MTGPDWPEKSHTHSADSLARRAPSSSYKPSPSRLTSISNPSLESQLAHDFMARANLASSSAFGLQQAQASAPPSPYGQPIGLAVAQGGGNGRNGMTLPAIRSWEEAESDEQGGEINPMFKVVSGSFRRGFGILADGVS